MRLPAVSLLLLNALGLSGCAALSSQPTPTRWTTGFWFWQGSSVDPAYSGDALDVLYIQVGTLRKERLPAEQWSVYGVLPHELPPAREYWLVYRYENQGVPDIRIAPKVAADIVRVRAEARERNLNVVGVQFDIDSPTPALPRYADFIRDVRKLLPKEVQVSITALLDWFRTGTSIGDVIAQVDEFVPQFYDLGEPSREGAAAIAAPIDAARWAPVFNRFGKRFRIGVSTFGRALLIRQRPPAQNSYRRAAFYGDLRPLDVATNTAFRLETSRNAADETVLRYRATRDVEVGYERLEAGDIFQFIISTPDAVRAAVRSARQMSGHLAGVVFFRWPSEREDWAMQPGEVLGAAGEGAPGARKANRVQAIAGDCAAVHCMDVYLESSSPLSSRPVRYRVRTSTPLEYFLPERNMPVRLAGASVLQVSLPPYCGRGRLYLGRAVALQRAEFAVEEEQ